MVITFFRWQQPASSIHDGGCAHNEAPQATGLTHSPCGGSCQPNVDDPNGIKRQFCTSLDKHFVFVHFLEQMESCAFFRATICICPPPPDIVSMCSTQPSQREYLYHAHTMPEAVMVYPLSLPPPSHCATPPWPCHQTTEAPPSARYRCTTASEHRPRLPKPTCLPHRRNLICLHNPAASHRGVHQSLGWGSRG